MPSPLCLCHTHAPQILIVTFPEHLFSMRGTDAAASYMVSLNLDKDSMWYYYDSHFTDEETYSWLR